MVNPALACRHGCRFEAEAAGALDLDTASLRVLATLALICGKHGALAPLFVELWRCKERS